MKEKEIETQMMWFVRSIGGYCQKVHSGSIMKSYTIRKGARKGTTRFHRINLADEGTPDILACIKGKFVGIEVKRDERTVRDWKKQAERNRRSAMQHTQQAAIRDAEGVTIVASSVEELRADFRELGFIS